jgi:colanic acid biosynthesis glycosyl transferase WcaI
VRILLLNQVFHPDVAATAQHAHDLARHLVAHGHEVDVIASRSIYGEKGATLPKRETIDGVHVHRVGRSLFGKAGIRARLLDFAMFYVAATFKAFTIRRPDVVICFTTPPFIALLGGLLKLLRGSRHVYWIMDLYPEVLVANDVLRARSPVTSALEFISRLCMRSADRIVVLGRCMRQRVLDKRIVRPERVVHLGVWSDHEEVRPIERDANPYREQWGLDGRFVVMYSGNFGLVHDVETMCRAAEKLQRDQRIAFAFVGGGKRKREVETFVKTLGLDARLEPYQPREQLDALLSCADVHLVSLLPGFDGLVVPSKLFGIMAAGRPAIVIGPPTSEISLVVQESGCGRVIAPGDVTTLANTIRELADNPALARDMGERGRRALQQQHDRAHRCEAWRRMLEELA